MFIYKNKLVIAIVVLQFLIELIRSVINEFTKNQFGTADVVNWNTNKIHRCSFTDFIDFSDKDVLGVFAQDTNTVSKTYTSIAPHWSLSIRFDLILYKSVDLSENEYVNLYFDNVFEKKFTKLDPSDGYSICSNSGLYGDQLILYSKNFTSHTSSTFEIKITTTFNEVDTSEGYAIRNLYLYVDTCHQSCQTCSGPMKEQCLTCPLNSSMINSLCICDNSKLFFQQLCLSSCPIGFINDSTNTQCIQDNSVSINNCGIADSLPGNCLQCNPGYNLLNGQCVQTCPLYAPLNSSTHVCEDYASKLIRGSYILKGLHSDIFGESEIRGLNLQISSFEGNGYGLSSWSGAYTTLCDGKTILGGPFLFSKYSSIFSTFNGLKAHWSVRLIFKYYIIDDWISIDTVYVTLGSSIYSIVQQTGVATNLCGRLDDDYVKVFDKNITHTSSTLILSIDASLDANPYVLSFGIREISILIDYCTDNCQSCNAGGCTVCASGYTLSNHICVPSCTSSQYIDSNNTCKNCDPSCSKCSGSSNCTQCPSGYILNASNQCVQLSCASGCYFDFDQNQCNVCSIKCGNCFQSTSNDCYDCSAGYFLFNSQCSTSCPFGFYPNSTTRKCEKCSQNCYGCFGPLEKDCIKYHIYSHLNRKCIDFLIKTRCISPYLKHNNSCIVDCPSGYYKDNQNKLCLLCQGNCASCYGPNQNNCISCKASFYLNPYKSTCVDSLSCPDNMYPNTTYNQCLQCHNSCFLCSGSSSSDCSSCKAGSYLYLGTCLSNCPSGTYQTIDKCLKCNISCGTCKGSASTDCLSCPTNYYLYNGSCYSSCPIGTTSNLQVCLTCDYSCKTCTQALSSTSCSSCYTGRFLYNQSCIDSCPISTYVDGQICKKCDSSCLTCKNSTSQDCLSCSKCKNGQCIPCPSGQTVVNNKCTACDIQCLTCYGHTFNQCLSCQPSKFLQGSECVPQCGTDYDIKPSTNICKRKCDPSCLTCDDINYMRCTSCSSSKILFNGECLLSCPSKYFYNSTSKQCENCISNCNKCVKNDVCITCSSPYFISNNICIKECPQNLKCYDINSQNCIKCPDTPKPPQPPTPSDNTNNNEQNNNKNSEEKKDQQIFDIKISKIFNLYISQLILLFLYITAGLALDQQENKSQKSSQSISQREEDNKLNQTDNFEQTRLRETSINLDKKIAKSKQKVITEFKKAIKYTLIGHPSFNIITFKSTEFNRVFRSFILFSKLLLFFIITYNMSIGITIFLFLLASFFWDKTFFFTFNQLKKKASLNIKLQILIIVAIVSLLTCLWLWPRVQILTNLQDSNWFKMSISILATDIFIIQPIFSFLSYLFTKITYFQQPQQSFIKILSSFFIRPELKQVIQQDNYQ